jgi:hypothetical protein
MHARKCEFSVCVLAPFFVALSSACTASVGDPAGSTGTGAASGSGGAAGAGVGGSSAGASNVGGAGGTGGAAAGSGAGGSSAAGGTGGSGGAVAGGTGGSTLDCSTPKASATRLRVLTESQVNNTVLDLLRLEGDFAKGLGLAMDDISLEHRAAVATQIAGQAAANLESWAPCTPAPQGDSAACKQQIIDQVGSMAYRRPLSDAERAELTTLFDAGVATKDFSTGVDWFLTGLLQAPDVVYEVTRPAPAEQPGQVVPLAPHEYATRLAYFVWDGPPDAALLDAAGSGGLADAAGRSAQISRMLADTRFLRGVTRFYAKWLHTSGFAELARDDEDFTEGVVSALETSLLMSATSIYSSPAPNVASLFSGDAYFFNDALRSFYGIAGSGAEFTAAPMTGQSRRGILTHPGLMALLARPGESNPISRGLYVLREILCVDVSPPPQDREIPDLPPVQAGVSTRQRLELHTSDPFCGGCHAMIDPSGFAFEGFDEVGRFRTTDQGVPVDTSGTFELGLDVDGAYEKGDDFLAKVAESQSVRACFAGHYLDFALSHPLPDPSDACSLQAVRQRFAATGDLRELVVTIASSDSFVMRLAEGIGQ